MKENNTTIHFEIINARKTTSRLDAALNFLLGAMLATMLNVSCLAITELLIHHHHAPTNTTMHQPEPTGQYADSLVCPD